MPSLTKVSKSVYGAHPLHLLVVLASLALGAYTVYTLGVNQLFNPDVWWQSIAVWFAVAIIGHDLILFPLYALADRLLPRHHHADTDHRQPSRHRIPSINYVRTPTLAVGLLFLLFFPGIIEQGATTYRHATGLTQQPFLARWLIITAVIYSLSAVSYAIRSIVMFGRQPKAHATNKPPDAGHLAAQDQQPDPDNPPSTEDRTPDRGQA